LSLFIETNRPKDPVQGKESDFPSLVSYELLSWSFYGLFGPLWSL